MKVGNNSFDKYLSFLTILLAVIREKALGIMIVLLMRQSVLGNVSK